MIKNDPANYLTIAKLQTNRREEYLQEQEQRRFLRGLTELRVEAPLPPAIAADLVAAGELTLLPPNDFFFDTLTATGEFYMIPVDRRMDWQAYDVAAEESCEPGPLPDYAVPAGEISHWVFSNARKVL
jgi:hypothetical protein